MNLDMQGQVALVCGGSKGIGKAIAIALANEGVQLCLLSRTSSELEKTASEIETLSGLKPKLIVGGVADTGMAKQAVSAALESFGRLDILINNAGGPPMGTFLEHSSEVWQEAANNNLFAVIEFTREAVLHMKERGYGRIVNITSVLAKEPVPAMVLSATLRAGVSAFAKTIATELASSGITVNTVGPNAVYTERAEFLTRQTAEREGISFDDALTRATQSLPIGRFATLEELGNVVTFLCSPLASYVSGVTLPVDASFSKSVF